MSFEPCLSGLWKASGHPWSWRVLANLLAGCLLGTRALAADALPPQAGGPAATTDVREYRLEGSQRLAPDEIAQAVAPFLGAGRSYVDIRNAMEALEQRYRAHGLTAVSVTLPEQEVRDGVVMLRASEGRVREVVVAGNRYLDAANIRASLPALREGAAPDAAAISRNVSLANQSPAKQLDVVLRATDKADELDATINVLDDNPLKAIVTLDNSGNESTGRYRTGVGLRYANLFDRDQVASVSYATSPGHVGDVSIWSVGYRIPLYVLGDSIDALAARSDVTAGTSPTVAGPLTFSGKGRVFGLHYNHNLARRGAYTAQLTAGMDSRDYINQCSLGAFGAAGCGAAGANVTVRPLSLAYSGQWSQPNWGVTGYASVDHNLSIGAAGDAAAYAAARPASAGTGGAKAAYSRIKFGTSLVGALPANWQGRVAVDGQYTRDALVAGEQFGLTGVTSVRGYRERELARDVGYVLNAELYTPELIANPGQRGSLRVLAFYDFARGRNQTLAGDQDLHQCVASAGLGARYAWRQDINVRFDIGRVLRTAGGEQQGDLRGHVDAFFEF